MDTNCKKCNKALRIKKLTLCEDCFDAQMTMIEKKRKKKGNESDKEYRARRKPTIVVSTIANNPYMIFTAPVIEDGFGHKLSRIMGVNLEA